MTKASQDVGFETADEGMYAKSGERLIGCVSCGAMIKGFELMKR